MQRAKVTQQQTQPGPHSSPITSASCKDCPGWLKEWGKTLRHGQKSEQGRGKRGSRWIPGLPNPGLPGYPYKAMALRASVSLGILARKH